MSLVRVARAVYRRWSRCRESGHAPAAARVIANPSGTYANEHPWLKCFKGPKNFWNERLKRFQTVTVGYENDHGHRQCLQVLLKFNALVGGQQGVERACSLAKQRAIAQAGPCHLGDGTSVVASQQIRERPGQRFIEQESHER